MQLGSISRPILVPVWIAEVGKYDPRKYVDRGGPKSIALLEKYAFQAALRALTR